MSLADEADHQVRSVGRLGACIDKNVSAAADKVDENVGGAE